MAVAKAKTRGVVAPSPSHTVHLVKPPENPFIVHSRAEMNESGDASSARIRPEPHVPFDFDHLSMLAASYGWTLRKQAGGLYYLLDGNKKTVENPYANDTAIKTDFNHHDLEDFLLTC